MIAITIAFTLIAGCFQPAETTLPSQVVDSSTAGNQIADIYLNEPELEAVSATSDFSDWTSLLRQYVNEQGKPNYTSWIQHRQDRARLGRLLRVAALQNLKELKDRADRQAFWINLYNMAGMEARLRAKEKPNSVPNDMYDHVFVYVGSEAYSLNKIEHQQLRSLKDARIHFALNCGANSCPLLLNHALQANNIDETLNAAAKNFLSSPLGAQWDENRKTLRLSKIFEWYRDDFGTDDQRLLDAIHPYLHPHLQKCLSQTSASETRIEFMEYDWTIAEFEERPRDEKEREQEPGETAMGQEKPENTSDAFPSEVEYWQTQTEQYNLGLQEAEALRIRLLTPVKPEELVERNGIQYPVTYADRIAKVTAAFQKQMKGRTALSSPVTQFDMSAERLHQQLTGGMKFPNEGQTFSAFDGRWFGSWNTTAVNHDWRPSLIHQPAKECNVKGLAVRGEQYAWIHNGFGWNYLVSSHDPSKSPYVLGQVYYLDENDLKKIAGRKPHVGFADIPSDSPISVTRLIWITEYEIFLEEVFPQPNSEDTFYVITAIYHKLFSDEPFVSPDATQATYTRRSNHRPAFIKIPWNPKS